MISDLGRFAPWRVWRHLRLAQKVTLAMVASLIPIVGLGIWVASFASNLLQAEVQENVGRTGQVQAERMSGAVRERTLKLQQLNDPAFLRFVDLQSSLSSTNDTRNFFQNFVEQEWAASASDGLEGIAVYIAGGTRLSAGNDVSPQADFLRTQLPPKEDSLLIGSAFVTEDGNEVHLPIARRVLGTDDGGISVVVVAEWNVAFLALQGVDLDTVGETAESFLAHQNTDGTLLVVSSSNLNLLGETISLQTNPVVGERIVIETLDTVNGETPVIQSTTRMPTDPNWISILEADQSELYSQLDTVRTRLITVFIAAGLVLLLVVVFAFRGFVRRLARMTELAESVASGDLTVRTNDKFRDELGRLSMSFDNMAQALAEDIARRERVEAQLEYQAAHDALTGLPNRSQLVYQLDEMLAESTEAICCLFVDLDGFKQVNDRLGHGAGDELLVRVGERLRDVLRPADFLARLGGDEFVIVLRGLGIMEAERLASRVVAALELPFIVHDQEEQISASIGVAAATGQHSTERLIKEADIAMYRAKAQGKGRAVRVTRETLDEVDERVSILTELREAAVNDELQLMLWPIGDLRDGSLRGMEATVRWHHPDRGLITPADFLPLAINSGFANQIDEWVILAATELMAGWHEAGLPVQDLELSINLTSETFIASRSRQLIIEEIGRHNLRPSNFRIEVAETVLRNEPEPLKDVFDTYRAVGIPVTLDRFGSDYSNLDLLPRFAIDAVKIDLHLISDLTNRLSSRALVSSLITLAQTAGLRVSAAGVDDEDLRQQLLDLGCYQGQGLWLSNSISTDRFVALLESRHMVGSA